MPTQSEPKSEVSGQQSEWAAQSVKPPRSVFGNYRPKEEARAVDGSSHEPHPFAPSLSPSGGEGVRSVREGEGTAQTLQSAIDTAFARSFLHRALAKAFEDPTPETWSVLTAPDFQAALLSAAAIHAANSPGLAEAARSFAALLTPDSFASFHSACLGCFGHAARGCCPLNEIEYGDIKADGLFQSHRLADLAAFYRAFGLELADDAAERQDHLGLELEFMSVLAAKEAYALDHQLDADDLALCRDAQKKFLRDHLGRWTPAFARRLAHMAGDSPLGALAQFTRAFLESECAHFGVATGSEDLLLRPVDEAAESMGSSCALTPLPPGALAAGDVTP